MRRRTVMTAAAVTVVVGAGVAFAVFSSERLPGDHPVIIVPGMLGAWPPEEYGIFLDADKLPSPLVLLGLMGLGVVRTLGSPI